MPTSYHLHIDSDEPIDLSKVFADLSGTYDLGDTFTVGDEAPPIPPSDPDPTPPPVPNYIPPIGDVWVLIVNGAPVGTYYTFASFQAAVASAVAASATAESGSILIGFAKGEGEIPAMWNLSLEPDFGGRGGGGGVRPTTGLHGGAAPGPTPPPTNSVSFAPTAQQSDPAPTTNERMFRNFITNALMAETGASRGEVTEAILHVERFCESSIMECFGCEGVEHTTTLIKKILGQ